MHCGHLQFLSGSWHHRNYILLDGKRHLLSIPIMKPHIKPISEAWFSDETWKKKHLKSLYQAYRDAPYFQAYYPALKEIILKHPHSLVMMNMHLTNAMAFWLGIFQTDLLDSAHWHFSGDAICKIIQMCRAVNADRYLSNIGAEGYLTSEGEARMQDMGIWHNWIDFKDPDAPNPLSAVHHLFHLGPKAAELIL